MNLLDNPPAVSSIDASYSDYLDISYDTLTDDPNSH